jgi:two-component system response regulator NreC
MARTVALVDEHPIFRLGLRVLLTKDPEFEVVGESGNVRDARALAGTLLPAVLVSAVTLPDGDGIAAVPDLRSLSPKTAILILTTQRPAAAVARALSAGATGCALKTQPTSEIVAAVRSVAHGERYVPPMEPVPDGASPADGAAPRLDGLSRREREIFELVIRGYSNERVASALSISIKTVETHRSHINHKLGVHSTGDLMRLAAREGLTL